jgi:hypothetical protein
MLYILGLRDTTVHSYRIIHASSRKLLDVIMIDPYDFYTEELKQPNATETD